MHQSVLIASARFSLTCAVLAGLKAVASIGNICVSHILVVDDDRDLRFIPQEVRAEGDKVLLPADGARGIALQRNQPALAANH